MKYQIYMYHEDNIYYFIFMLYQLLSLLRLITE